MSDILNPIPQHIAIIMDGNGRWAKQRHLPRLAGHNAGAKAVERTLEAAKKRGIKYITLYAFSTENWARPKEEINGLMTLLEETLDRYTKDAAKHGVKLLVSGEKQPLPPNLIKKIEYAVSSTKDNTKITLNLALNYGGRQEIIQAVNRAIKDGKKSLQPEDLQQYLYQPHLPEPELLIRTSGEERLSNFLLWQAAYSEFYFTSVLWPDFNEKEFDKALEAYQKRVRRFGAI